MLQQLSALYVYHVAMHQFTLLRVTGASDSFVTSALLALHKFVT
jgi:hypothetical protein